MTKISKLSAINEIIETIEAGNIEKANKMIRVVMSRMEKGKIGGEQIEYIELKTPNEERLFENYIEK